jgi:hypothetical protein
VKIRPVRAEMFHANVLTDKHYEADSRFLQFSKRVQKNYINTLTSELNLSAQRSLTVHFYWGF